ncbi:hypothetical protein [Spongiimicrobium salis]|uniref:hypothetical protein n=1 Tax=Spongiimicrobium salis TaxID=1667022 RepID=UPI00374DD616
MKKDIEIPIAKEVSVALVHEWNEEFLDKEWNAYIINHRNDPIEMVLVMSKGHDADRKTSTMRHAIEVVGAKSFEKIENVQEEVLGLNNEFYVTFFADNKMYERKYHFSKNTVNAAALTTLPVINKEGIYGQ